MEFLPRGDPGIARYRAEGTGMILYTAVGLSVVGFVVGLTMPVVSRNPPADAGRQILLVIRPRSDNPQALPVIGSF